MNSSEHPDDNLILAYLDAPDGNAFGDLRLHLASCGYCRRRTRTTALLREQGQWIEGDAAEVDPALADLLAGRLDAAAAARVRDEIRQDPARLRAALHYASHARAMGRLRAAPRRRDSIWRAAKTKIGAVLNWRAPLWQTAPVLTALLLVVAVVLAPPLSRDRVEIVAFDDQPPIRFVAQDAQPGIGFFTQRGGDTLPFAGVDVEFAGDRRLRLSWPAVDGVRVYKLKLQVFRDGEATVLARATLREPVAEIEIDRPLTQHRYEWVLSGETGDHRSFHTSGGFVVARH